MRLCYGWKQDALCRAVLVIGNCSAELSSWPGRQSEGFDAGNIGLQFDVCIASKGALRAAADPEEKHAKRKQSPVAAKHTNL
jgi:hypothetical protein